MNINNNESMNTAIEPDSSLSEEERVSGRRRVLLTITGYSGKFLDFIGSENALFILLFMHWIVSCMLHLFFSDRGQVISEKLSFVAMIYFVAMLLVFISMMTTISVFMIPLVSISFFMQLFCIYLFFSHVLEIPQQNPLAVMICEKSEKSWLCQFFQGNGGFRGILLLTFGLFLYTATLIAMADQAARNMVSRQRHMLRERHLLYLNMAHVNRNTPVGPVNPDEPPRYSTLEHPITPPRVVPNTQSLTAETSPPRYSYWERTFPNPKNRGESVKISPAKTI